ncbi:MAG TPA: hypothetical protein VFP58_05655 [Candidatus Eisenbacteria bacterium]|nr:hypothetical protein [Candidatus Eisenbacteria bacterium]
MQTDVMERHPELRLKVYAVWFHMVWTDSRRRWPEHLISDPRVEHFWDEEKALGRWYSDRISDGKHVVWDTFLLYPPGTRLGAPPESLLALGATIVEAREELRKAVEELERPRT